MKGIVLYFYFVLEYFKTQFILLIVNLSIKLKKKICILNLVNYFTRCIVNLYAKTEPIIETSNNMVFRPFNGAYADLLKHMEKANLDPTKNLWFAIYDFNDESKSGKNSREVFTCDF